MNEQRTAWPWEKKLFREIQTLRVSSSTQAPSLATAMLRYMDEGRIVYLECIGAQSAYIAMKAVAQAQSEAGAQGKMVIALPHFEKKEMADREYGGMMDITALKFMVSRAPVLMWFDEGAEDGQ